MAGGEVKGLRLTEEQFAARQQRVTTHLIQDERKRSKYNNHRFTDSEGVWDSKKERERWGQLRILESAGKIQELDKKIPYELIPVSMKHGKRLRAVVYIADFVYIEDGNKIVEDVKGYRNKVYLLKKRLMWEKFGIDILET
jgi:hypothetical protein